MNVENPNIPQENIIEKNSKRIWCEFHIKHYKNGSILLEPRVLVEPKISKETLEMIEESVDNYKKGEISKPIDVSRYKGIKH